MKDEQLSDYRAKAEECLRMADAARTPEHKQSWLRLAASWFRMLPDRPSALPVSETERIDRDETDPSKPR